MAGWRVKYNRLGLVVQRMPRQLADGQEEVADAMVRTLKGTLWKDTGLVRRVTDERNLGRLHIEVMAGFYLGQGFYSGFQEFGVASRGLPARPIVVPTAHRMERQYRLEMGERVRKACDV
jgi:hypothetical protein